MTHAEVRRVVGGGLTVLVGLDLVLVAINALGAPSFLNLDEEKNLPTWYSSAKLLLTGLAALWCMTMEPESERRGLRGLVWPAFAALFTALSMDETATSHERLAAFLMKGSAGDSLRDRFLGGDASKDAFIWPVLFAPVALAALYFIAAAVYSRMRTDRRNLVLGVLGCLSFAAAMVLEVPVVFDSAPIAAWGDAEMARYRFLTVVEESAEVIGATLMLAALALHGVHLSSRERGPVDETVA